MHLKLKEVGVESLSTQGKTTHDQATRSTRLYLVACSAHKNARVAQDAYGQGGAQQPCMQKMYARRQASGQVGKQHMSCIRLACVMVGQALCTRTKPLSLMPTCQSMSLFFIILGQEEVGQTYTLKV